MEFKSFRIDVPGKGTVDVEFNLHFNDSVGSVREIKVHSDFDSGLPHRPQLMLHDNAWQLYAQLPVMKNDEVVITDQYYNDPISNEIVQRLLEFKEEAKVR